MTALHRREFLGQAGKLALGAAAGASALAAARPARAASANEKIVLGIVGVRGRGWALSMGFGLRPDCEIAYVADVDTRLFDQQAPDGYQIQFPESVRGLPRIAALAKAQGKAPKTVQDFRRVLDDKSVDAVVIATPDHWHAPAAIWACQAGKDVYVEKPCSQNCWEGRKMVEAARKYKRIVQVGTQNRSAAYNMAAKKYIEEGKLGKIHFCRVLNQKQEDNFRVRPDSDLPAGFDWDMFNGPAPAAHYNANLQDNWHAYWRYSGGDIVNDAIHQIDLARWLLGVDYPTAVYSTGEPFHEAGAAETPDTQLALMDFDDLILSFELTLYTPYMLKVSPIIRESDTEFPYWPQCGTRIEIYGTKGMMVVGRHGGGWQVFERPKLHAGVVTAQQKGRFPDPEHKQNFVDCIRTRKRPNADIEEGHRSALLVHLANISYRLGGQKLTFDPQTEKIVGNEAAMQLYRREYRKPYVIEETV